MAGLTKSLVEVGISMVLRDEFSQQAGRVSSSYVHMMNDMNQWNRAVSQTAGSAFDYGVSAITKMADAYRHYADISGEMFMVGKIAGASAKEQKELLDLTQQINMATPLSNMDIASGERYLAMAGNSAERIKEMIKPAAELATVFKMQLGGKGGTADLMTNIMSTFGIAANDAKRTADILYTATTSANMNLTDLAQALQYSGADFRNAGVDLATAAAAIGVLGDQGIQASSAGTALANMIRYLTLSITGQKTKGAEMLKAMGISREDLVDSNGELKNMTVLIDVLSRKLMSLTGEARVAAMYNIFGVRGQRAQSALMYSLMQGNKMMDIIAKSNATDGTILDQVNKEFLETDMGKIMTLIASLDNLKMSIGANLSFLFKPMISGLTMLSDITKWLSSTGIGRFATLATVATTFTVTLINGFRLLTGIYKIVGYTQKNLGTSTQQASTGMSVMNEAAVALEGHLAAVVALMQEYVALSYAAGGAGGTLASRKGRMNINTARGRAANIATAASTAAMTAAAARYGTASGGTTGGGTTTPKAAGGKGSLIFGALGGWWGIGISVALTALPYLIEWLGGKMDDNKEALEANTQQLSSQEIMAEYQANYYKAVQSMVESSRKDSTQTLNITINGQPANINNNEINLDDYGYYY